MDLWVNLDQQDLRELRENKGLLVVQDSLEQLEPLDSLALQGLRVP